MAFADTTWYCSFGNGTSTGYFAVAQFAVSTAYTAGQLVRQLTAPAVGSERVFAVIVAGTSASSEPTWVLTRGAKTVSNTVTFQECTGASAVNGDLTNTPTWSGFKAISSAVTLGAIIQRNNGASYWICSTAGSTGASEPAWSNNTAGTTQTDSTVTWTCLGVVGNFTGGQAPHARLANAVANTWFVAGNTIYVGDNHAESQTTAITITPLTTITTIGKLICHNHSGSYPPTSLTTGATVSTTAAANITLNPGAGGTFYAYGVTFIAGVGASAACSMSINTSANSMGFYENCSFQLATTSAASSLITIANSAGTNQCNWNNCTVKFGNAAQYIFVNSGAFNWQNTGQILASGSSVPTALLVAQSSGTYANMVLEALDLSQITSNIFGANTTNEGGNRLIKDCKLNAAVTVQQSGSSTLGLYEQVVRSDSGATAYKSARYAYEGTETTETSITRVGGASDPTGQAQSRKIVTTANVQWLRPFKAEPYAIWNPTTGSNVTVTVCGTVNAGALPNNDDIWLEVEYLGSAATPLGAIVTTTKANLLAANAAVASDSSTWNGTSYSYPTWDPSSVAAVTLSGSNLVATNTGTTSANQGAMVASSYGKTAGKYYFEATFTTFIAGINIGVGVGTTASTYTGMGNSATTGTESYKTGSVYSNGSSVLTWTAWGVGTTMGMAVDLDNRQFWVHTASGGNWNNSSTADPATNTGGLAIPAGTMVPFVTFGGTAGVANNVITVNFGASSFIGSVPSGFNPGWVSIYTPFKLVATLSAPQPGLAGYLHARVRVAKPSMTVYVDPSVQLS